MIVAEAQNCVADWTIQADSFPALITPSSNVDHQLCPINPCSEFSLWGDFTVRVVSPTFSNRLTLEHFTGRMALSILDTNCLYTVFDTCITDIDSIAAFEMQFGRNVLCLVRLSSSQPFNTMVRAVSVSNAPPAPYIHLCPVGSTEPSKSPLRCRGVNEFVTLDGRRWNDDWDVPCGTLYWDGSKCAFTYRMCE